MRREDERATADTLNGLVFAMEARIPGRGEVLTHSSGAVFEVMDADPRRINLLKISNIPKALD
jgi:magnesium and cobalt transporter